MPPRRVRTSPSPISAAPTPVPLSRRDPPPHQPSRGRQASPRWYNIPPPQWYVLSTPLTRELGKIDILVNNVGGYRLFTNDLTHAVTVLDITEEEWRRVMESNLTTAFTTCKAVLPHMMERRSGVIVNLTSRNVARRGRAGQASYGAAKAAVERLSESLADEVKDFGIAVNILDPGWNLTKPNDDYDDEVHKRMRLPDDIAEVAVYMALQTPETMTGQLVSAAEYDEEHGIERLSAYERLHV